MRVKFISYKDIGGTRTIYVLIVNEKIMWGNETNDIINQLFKSFLDNYQKKEQIMRGESDFIFESADLIDYNLNKIGLG